MSTEDLHAVAQRLVETVIRQHPDQAAALASLVLSEVLALGLFGGTDDEVTGFADAVNGKLGEIALAVDAPSSWHLVRAERPRRH
jgi:hypothetical protein